MKLSIDITDVMDDVEIGNLNLTRRVGIKLNIDITDVMDDFNLDMNITDVTDDCVRSEIG